MTARVAHRQRMVIAVLLAVCSVLAGCKSAASGSSPAPSGQPLPHDTRPNIVFVLTDDLTANLLPFMPQVRALQQDGTTFANNFVVDSLCCPSRSATFTGEYPHDTGVFTNTAPDGGYDAYNQHGDPAQSFALALQRSGYRTGFYGKYLNGYRPIYPGAQGWDEWHAAGNGYAEYDYRLRNDDTVTWHGNLPNDYLTDVLARQASDFITSSAGSGRPFMMEVASFAPHLPATPAPQDANKLPGLTAPRTRSFNKPVKNSTRWLATVPTIPMKNLAALDRQFRKRALAVMAVDRMIGRLRQQLRDSGLENNTYFVFSSDNGYHIGEHRLRPGKQTAFDTDIKVPLVVAGPGVPAGRTMPEMTSNIDLCPTFEEIGKLKPGPRVDGVSLLSLWQGRHPENGQRTVLIEHHNPGGRSSSDPDYQANTHGDPPTYEAVRTTRELYVEYADGEREYYDLRKDPAELDNLAWKLPRARLAHVQRQLAALKSCHTATSCQRAAR